MSADVSSSPAPPRASHATAARLLGNGRSVVGVDLDEAGLEKLARVDPDRVGTVVGDVAERSTHERAADAAEELGQLRGWVNGAGIWAKTRAHDFAEEDLDRILAVNLKGSILGCSVACARFLTGGEGGAIVNVSSIEAIVGFPDAVAYEASKGGIDALTRQVAVDYGPAGIRCNGVRPGAIMTPLADVYLEAYAEDREDAPVVARPQPTWSRRRRGGRCGRDHLPPLRGRAVRLRRACQRRRWRDRALLRYAPAPDLEAVCERALRHAGAAEAAGGRRAVGRRLEVDRLPGTQRRPGAAREAGDARAMLRAASELGYRPHAAARGLKRAETGALGLLVPPLTNPVYVRIIRGAFERALERDFVVLLVEDVDPSQADRTASRLVQAGESTGS